jgi:hypothetical protein
VLLHKPSLTIWKENIYFFKWRCWLLYYQKTK